jgi:hypothetical protein
MFLAWRNRRRFVPRTTRLDPQATLSQQEYYSMRNKGELGPETTLKILCDGGKMHKLTFYARGPVKLHNHNARAEHALRELSNTDQALPRCLRILSAWRAERNSYDLDLAVYNRLSSARSYRHIIKTIHSQAKNCVDADGLDTEHAERLKSMIEDIASHLRDCIVTNLEHRRPSQRYQKDWCASVGIDITKLRLGIRKRPELVRPAPMLFDLEKLKRERKNV